MRSATFPEWLVDELRAGAANSFSAKRRRVASRGESLADENHPVPAPELGILITAKVYEYHLHPNILNRYICSIVSCC